MNIYSGIGKKSPNINLWRRHTERPQPPRLPYRGPAPCVSSLAPSASPPAHLSNAAASLLLCHCTVLAFAGLSARLTLPSYMNRSLLHFSESLFTCHD